MALNGYVVDYGCELSEPMYMKRCEYYELIYLTSYLLMLRRKKLHTLVRVFHNSSLTSGKISPCLTSPPQSWEAH